MEEFVRGHQEDSEVEQGKVEDHWSRTGRLQIRMVENRSPVETHRFNAVMKTAKTFY